MKNDVGVQIVPAGHLRHRRTRRSRLGDNLQPERRGIAAPPSRRDMADHGWIASAKNKRTRSAPIHPKQTRGKTMTRSVRPNGYHWPAAEDAKYVARSHRLRLTRRDQENQTTSDRRMRAPHAGMDLVREPASGPAACRSRIFEPGNPSTPERAPSHPPQYFLHRSSSPNTVQVAWILELFGLR